MPARLLPLVVLLTLSACSGARLAPADGSAEAVWAELVVLAAAPSPDLAAIADRITLRDGSGAAADAAEAGVALTQVRARLPGIETGGRVAYRVVRRETLPAAAGRVSVLHLRFDGVPGEPLKARFVETDGRARFDGFG